MHPELLNNPTFLRYFDTWQRDPKSIVFAPLADFFCQYKLYADARKVCESGVKYNPNSVLAHYCLAKAYIHTREWHSARHEAQWVLARVPAHEGALDVLRQVEQHQAPVRHIVVQPTLTPAILSPDLIQMEELAHAHVLQNKKLADAMVAAGGASSPMVAEVQKTVVVQPSTVDTDDGLAVGMDAISDDAVDAIEDEEMAEVVVSHMDELPLMRRVTGSSVASAEPAMSEAPKAPETLKPVPSERPQKLLPWQTVTMAKIYSQQGLFYKARTIYKAILSRDPLNTEAQAGLVTLERMIRDAAA